MHYRGGVAKLTSPGVRGVVRLIDIPMAEIERVCLKYGLSELSLFGSAVRDDFTDLSDVDVLIQPGPDTPRGFFALSDIQSDLERAFQRRIDLVTVGALSPLLRDEILNNKRKLYVQAP